MGNVAKKHSAGASFAGFLYQLDLALLWLTQSQIGASVGIETLDDVTMITADGEAILGQSKLSYARNTLSDFNPNLWKTLSIWLKLVTDEGLDLDKTEFHLVSNFEINTGIVAKLKPVADNAINYNSIADELKSLAKRAPQSCQPYASEVKDTDGETLVALLARVRVKDGIPSDPVQQAPLFASKLNLPGSIASPVVRGLRGWIQERVEIKFASKEPAWLEREAFCEELSRLNAIHFENRLVLRAEAEIPVTDAARRATHNATFVRQLGWVDVPADEVLDAMNDYLRSAEERTRLADDNDVTERVFNSFQDNLVGRWKNLHRQTADDHRDDVKFAGRKALRATMDHREPLDGQPTSEYYLTRGTYHKLADGKSAQVGWHPQFRELLKKNEEDSHDAHE